MGLFDIFKKKKSNPLLEGFYGFGTGACLDEIPDGHGEFGLEPTNPVPIDGLIAIKVYIASLLTPDGQRIKFERVRSIDLPQFGGPTDEYNLFDQTGKLLTKLYVNAYARGTSERAPKGFSFLRP